MDSSFVPMIGMLVVLIAIVAARKKIGQEEARTTYLPNDLDGWEFKILRSETGRFKKREILQKVCGEEARAGWEMVEKFDDQRIRFKRRIERRSSDQHLEFDPYRTSYGSGPKPIIFVILGLVILGVGLFALFAMSR